MLFLFKPFWYWNNFLYTVQNIISIDYFLFEIHTTKNIKSEDK